MPGEIRGGQERADSGVRLLAQVRYTRGAILFHWALAALILLNASLALFRETFASYAVQMISAHKVIGLIILVLSLARLVWRLTHPPPPFPPSVGRWEARVANGVHRLLYVFMIGVPLAGWVFSSLAPDARPLDYRGLESVPELPLAQNDAASFFWHEVHELMGFAMIGLFLLHIAGALTHHFLDRSSLLARMIPWLKTTP